MRLRTILLGTALAGTLGLGAIGCGSNGYLGHGCKGDIEKYRIEELDYVGGGVLSDGIGLAAMARDREDPNFGEPHFYVAIRASGSTTNKIVIYDLDTGEPIKKLEIDDK